MTMLDAPVVYTVETSDLEPIVPEDALRRVHESSAYTAIGAAQLRVHTSVV
jgi:hypothetical protein